MGKEKMKNKYKITIAIVFVIIIAIIIAFYVRKKIDNSNDSDSSTENKSSSFDGSQMTSEELIEMFEKEGYYIEMTLYEDTSAIFICFRNDNNSISITRSTFFGITESTYMTFSILGLEGSADLLNVERNETYDEKQQYETYLNWLQKYNITSSQLANMLDDYCFNNSDKIEITDTETYLQEINEQIKSSQLEK